MHSQIDSFIMFPYTNTLILIECIPTSLYAYTFHC